MCPTWAADVRTSTQQSDVSTFQHADTADPCKLKFFMYLVAIAWLYVALMMALAEALHPGGTVLGAIVTFLFYGLLPTALVMYLMGTPLRRKAARAREALEDAHRLGTASPVNTAVETTPAPAADIGNTKP